MQWAAGFSKLSLHRHELLSAGGLNLLAVNSVFFNFNKVADSESLSFYFFGSLASEFRVPCVFMSEGSMGLYRCLGFCME